MAVRKRTGFKGVSSPKLTALKAQRDAANKRLASANARIKASEAKSKAAKARSKAAIERSKVAKKKIQKIKSKSKARKIQTQRGVIKARGGGPASRPLSKVVSNAFMNPFPQAEAFQAPWQLAWKTVSKGGKAVINPRTKRALRSAHTETTKTKGEVKVFEGGQPGILGMPVGTGQKNKAGRKIYTTAMSGDISQSMTPNVFLKEGGGEDFTKASTWWADYTKLTVAGKVEKGGGQPGLVKGGGPSAQEKSQPGWYMKPDKEGKGEFKVSGPAGGYRVLAGKGKTKTWLGGSTRIEAGAQPGGKWAYEKWFKFLAPEQQKQVSKTFTGSAGLYQTVRPDKYGRVTTVKKVTGTDMNTAWKKLNVNAQAEVLKQTTKQIQTDVGRFGFRNLTDKDKKDLLGKAGIKFE